jgi:hypothetical protein
MFQGAVKFNKLCKTSSISSAVVYLILLVVLIRRAISALCDELVAMVKL